jgi:phosphohistidine phosphatase
VEEAVTTIYVVRHAVAAEQDDDRWPDDSLRPLTKEGAKSFRRAARGLRKLAPAVDTVLSSPYVRAWKTAEILHEDARWPEPERCDELAGERSPADALGVVRDRGTVAVVGHEPFLSGLVALLLDAELSIVLKKGSVVCIEDGVLSWYATPKMLRGLA